METLVECVPNFSEGRRPEVYNAIAAAIRQVRGAHLLNVSPDPDHNRTVITFAGSPEAVEEAAYRAIRRAAELINLDEHQGEHPRLGATDVCPFVPLRGMTLADCVALAERLGQRVGEELGIAVYLYGAAARRPDREQLADIRRGEYERWKEEITSNPARQPDFGPAEPRPWGATAIGARDFLIAYNLYLNSADVGRAEAIARAVRYSSGGLRYVQARGFLVDGQAQVSLNLTDYRRTPLHRVQELVRREAGRYGLSITRAELVGLVPQQALNDAARWYLQLDGFDEGLILESRLAAAMADPGMPVPRAFLETLASGAPTPGGGSVAALTGALAAALTQMVASLTLGRKRYEAVAPQVEASLATGAVLRRQLTAAVTEDAAAFEALLAAMRDDTVSGDERSRAVADAAQAAGEVPLGVARWCVEVAELARTLAQVGNRTAITDAGVAAVLARAGVEAAGLNVRINALSLGDEVRRKAWLAELVELEDRVRAAADAVQETVAARAGFQALD